MYLTSLLMFSNTVNTGHLFASVISRHRGVVVFIAAEIYARKPKFRIGAESKFVRGVLEIYHGENLWQWPQLEISINAFRRSTTPPK